jgi:CheY-like chemotaxis protein
MGTEHILVVDDEEWALTSIQLMLERLGYKVTALTSPLEAMEAFRSQPVKFDLVITDIAMPDMTGQVLARELTVIQPDIPIILCTGYSERISKEKAEEIGIEAYLMKPIEVDEMAKTIRTVLGR